MRGAGAPPIADFGTRYFHMQRYASTYYDSTYYDSTYYDAGTRYFHMQRYGYTYYDSVPEEQQPLPMAAAPPLMVAASATYGCRCRTLRRASSSCLS